MAAHNQNGCGRLAGQAGLAGCPISVWQGQISVLFLVRDAGFDEDVSAGRFRGCAVRASMPLSEDWRPMMGIGITGLSQRPGLASWLVISLSRRMCFAVETEDRFHRVPRPPSRQHSWRSSQHSTVLYPYSVLVMGTALTVASRVRLGSSW